MSFTIASNNQTSSNSLRKGVKDFYTENYKTLLTDIEPT